MEGKIMECSKHPGVEMIVKEMALGWGNESKLVCPECEKEKASNSSDQVNKGMSKPGWQ